ncbi:22770_t:CDS:1, partial [Gigaspora margarita]
MSVPYSQEKSYYRERYKRLKVSKGVIDPYSKKQQLVIVETEPTKVKKSQKTRKSKIPPEIRQEFVNISSRFTKY